MLSLDRLSGMPPPAAAERFGSHPPGAEPRTALPNFWVGPSFLSEYT